jgi:hypothetical protein
MPYGKIGLRAGDLMPQLGEALQYRYLCATLSAWLECHWDLPFLTTRFASGRGVCQSGGGRGRLALWLS